MPSVVGKGASVAATSTTLPATVQAAAVPAPASKPATATLPAPTKPPKETSAAKTRTSTVASTGATSAKTGPSSAPETPAINPIAKEPNVLDTTELEQYAPYFEAVRGISALREKGQAGAQPWRASTERYPSMSAESTAYLPMNVSWSEKTTRSAGMLAPPIMPPKDIENVTFGQMARTARSVDLAYQGAVEAAGDADSALRRAATDPSKTPNDLKALEDEKVRALRRVADFAAVRREFGMETPTIAQGQAPLLAPAPTVGPRTGGGKEYY